MGIGGFRKSWRLSGNILTRQMICLVAAFGAAVGAAVGCAAIPARAELRQGRPAITKGPVLLRVYQDRAALMWETSTAGACKLHYGKAREAREYVESTPEEVSYEVKEDDKTVKRTAYIHKVWLEDLEAGQVYRYRVTGPEVRSRAHRFRTAPVDTDKVRFIVYGDSRSNPRTHRKLVELMIKKKADFVVNCGDLVSSGSKYEQWGPQHFEPVKGLAERTPVYIAKGNHEGGSGNYEKLLIPQGQKNSYAFDYGPVHYFCLDNVSRGQGTKERLESIVRDAKGSGAEWKFVSYHIPSLNFGGHHSTWGRPDALPRLAEAGIDFVLTGHSHQYERFRPVEPADGTGGSYVTYITTGGGGASLSEVEPTEQHACADRVHHFCLFEIKGNKLKMKVFNLEGKVIDHLEITKSKGGLNKEYLQTAVPMEEMQRYQQENLRKKN